MTKSRAIEILNDEYNGCIEYREALKNCDDIDELNDTLIALLMAIDVLQQDSSVKAESVNGWISMKDRRPEPDTWVLAYIKYPSPVFEFERGIRKMNNIKKMFYDGKSFYCDFGTINYWQPLPQKPESEDDAE